MSSFNHQVLIAGGGPTGLMLAGELALAGIDVAIIERRPTRTLIGARAGGLHIRSLEILDQRGIVDRFLAEGQPHSAVGFHVPLDVSDLPTRFPYLLALRQAPIERLLADWVGELGVPIHYGVDVLDVAQDDGAVQVVSSTGERFETEWLAGCDGGRSRIRKSTGIAFAGWDASTGWLIAEVRMTEPPELGFRTDSLGRHAMSWLDDGETVGVVLAGQNPLADGDPTLTELASTLRSVYGTDFGVHAPTWLSRFSDAARQAAVYRDRRILLAGDAAHIHSPMGGQGLNLGLQDAVNLGWKLAQVVKGQSPVALLDSYTSERHPVAARVLRNSIAMSVLRYPGERSAILGEVLAELLAMNEPRQRFAAMMSGLDIKYDCGDGHPLLGRRMPDLDIVTDAGPTRVYEFLHDGRHLMLDFGTPVPASLGRWSGRVRFVEARFDGVCVLPVIGAVSVPTAILIRPDGHVAWVGDGEHRYGKGAFEQYVGIPTFPVGPHEP